MHHTEPVSNINMASAAIYPCAAHWMKMTAEETHGNQAKLH